MTSTRFPITFDAPFALISRALFISPSDSYVEVGTNTVSVRMAWAFRATIDRAYVKTVAPLGKSVLLTRGVHGWGGRWLVNGAGEGILAIDFEPPQRAFVLGFPVNLRQLQVSVAEPATLATALARGQTSA